MVDDEPQIREILRDLLEDEGCRVSEASNGQEALTYLGQNRPDVILLDMRMPVMDGWRFAETYRQQAEPRVPIVVMTAAQDARRWASEIGADAYIPKPFEIPELFRILGRFVSCIQE